jgi:lysophospholipase L1-like esterase
LAGFRFINQGIDGDLAWNGLERLDRVIAENPDFVSILIGTNDVNATMSERNRVRYRSFNQLPTEPSIEWYADNLSRIVQQLQTETQAKLALLSLAVIGEDLQHEANQKVELYNDVIRTIAREASVAYLPLHERMVAYLHEHEGDRASLPPRLEYRDGLHNIGNAVALHASGLSWDEVSHRNGLLVTTDGLHLNSKGAGMVADLIGEWLVLELEREGEEIENSLTNEDG